MDNQLEAGLNLIDSLEKSKGKYIDQITGTIKKCSAIGVLSTDFKDGSYVASSVLFVPITEIIITAENTGQDFHFDVCPFIGISHVEKEKYPVVKNYFSKSIFKTTGYKDLVVQYNRYARDTLKKHNLRFIAVFIIKEDTNTLDQDLEIIPISKEEYYLA
jgi:hypothetical protein